MLRPLKKNAFKADLEKKNGHCVEPSGFSIKIRVFFFFNPEIILAI